jgi:ABC-type sugar transport system ATPase subunit
MSLQLKYSPGGMSMQGKIKIKGARENNLKNISLEIPKNKLLVITGPSGSGKSIARIETSYTGRFLKEKLRIRA